MSNMQQVESIRTFGRWLRAGVGIGLLVFATATQHLNGWDVAGAVIVMPAVAVGTATVVSRLLARAARGTNTATPIAAAVVIILLVLGIGVGLTYVSPIDAGALYAFVGLSMVVAGAKGFAGCEILALPNLLLHRRLAIWCPLFSPVDTRPRRHSPGEAT
jgi:hypothetical protein